MRIGKKKYLLNFPACGYFLRDWLILFLYINAIYFLASGGLNHRTWKTNL